MNGSKKISANDSKCIELVNESFELNGKLSAGPYLNQEIIEENNHQIDDYEKRVKEFKHQEGF